MLSHRAFSVRRTNTALDHREHEPKQGDTTDEQGSTTPLEYFAVNWEYVGYRCRQAADNDSRTTSHRKILQHFGPEGRLL